MPRLADPLGSYAVLIGTNAYEHLEKLPAVANNLARLRELLTDENIWGLPDDRCIVVSDPQTAQEFMNPIKYAAENVTDTLLLYYAGHGLLHHTTQTLRLTLRGSDQDRTWTSLPYEYVRDVLQETTANNKIVLLDCCYSGRAFMDGEAGPDDGLVHVDGTYLMTASSRNVRAMCYPNERYSAFTGELIDVLEAGLPNDDEYLGLPSLYLEVRARLARKRRPKPEQHVHNAGTLITFARNRAFPRTPRAFVATPPRQVSAAPAIPEHFQAVVRQAPRDILAEAARRDPAQAEELLEAFGTYAVAQGVAALVEILAHHDRAPETEFVLRGAALRSPADLVAIATVLGELGLSRPASRLFEKSVSGVRRPDEIAAIAVILKSSPSPLYNVVVFLCQGLLGCASTDDMVDLIEALWAAGLDAEARELVVLTSDRLPTDELITLADQLRDGGRPRTAFALYRRLIRPLAQRPPQEVAELVGAMRTAHQADIADGLLGAVADRLSWDHDAGELVAFREALGREGLDEDARQLPVLVADRLGLDAAISVAAGLRALGQEEPADAMMLHHGLRMPNCDIVTLVRALREAGRPELAFTILRLTGELQEPSRIPAIVTALHDSGLASDEDRVLTALAAPATARDRIVEALDTAYAMRDRHFATALMTRLAKHKPVAELASVVGDLVTDRERAFVDAIVAFPHGASADELMTSGLRLEPVPTLRLAVETSPQAVHQLQRLVRAHDPALLSWLLRQSAGLPITTLTDLLGILGDDETAVRSIAQSCARMSIEDLLTLVAELEQRGEPELAAKVVRRWTSEGGGAVAADLVALLLDEGGFAAAAAAARNQRVLAAGKPDLHGITQEIAATIKAAMLLGGPSLREPGASEVPRSVRRFIGNSDVRLFITFQRDFLVHYAFRGFLALTGTELVYFRADEPLVRVRYAEFLHQTIAMTADRDFQIGGHRLSLRNSGISNRQFVDLLLDIQEIVRRGIEAPGQIEPLPADRAIAVRALTERRKALFSAQ